MRWLIWTVLSTLFMLLSSTKVASSTIPNPEIATKNSMLAATFPVHWPSVEYYGNAKRSLRDNSNKISTSELKMKTKSEGLWTPFSIKSSIACSKCFTIGERLR
ncbi:hypothetical protein PI124_g8875 [Phytophthora idaei]|nr:hypothetical protein PI125_g12420 [Phytophthora idaei]KAG3158126.1 hypothetical protein PI126_g7999 [Phytophthora idaei]KAG3246405.1 hypothetical protein PI124_g8875 [Phytophthora idaei]